MKNTNFFLSTILILTVCINFIACGSSVEISPEMEGFMTTISSTKSIDDAAGKYGYSNEDIPLNLYELEDPNVINSSIEGETTCYDVNIKHGIFNSEIKVCWENGKITNITEL